MNLRSVLISTLLVTTLGASTTVSGAGAPHRHHRVVEITVAPPEPRVVVIPAARRGYAWAPGYWRWTGHKHAWVDGRWIREKHGEHWVSAHWEEGRHGYWHFEKGHWERS